MRDKKTKSEVRVALTPQAKRVAEAEMFLQKRSMSEIVSEYVLKSASKTALELAGIEGGPDKEVKPDSPASEDLLLAQVNLKLPITQDEASQKLISLYHKQKISGKEIARRIGRSKSAVNAWIQREGI